MCTKWISACAQRLPAVAQIKADTVALRAAGVREIERAVELTE